MGEARFRVDFFCVFAINSFRLPGRFNFFGGFGAWILAELSHSSPAFCSFPPSVSRVQDLGGFRVE